MKNKKIIYFAILLISLLAISSVSASEIDKENNCVATDYDDSIDQENLAIDSSENTIGETNFLTDSSLTEVEKNSINEIKTKDENILSANEGNFTELKGLLSDRSNETITLTKNYTLKSGNNININGNNLIIQGEKNKNITITDKVDSGSLFIITGNNVTLKNIYFNNSHKEYNNNIVWNGSSGKIENCTFFKIGTKNFFGGAIHWRGSDGVITNCSFINCTNGGGQEVYWDNYTAYGGVIFWNGSDGSISNCNFINTTNNAQNNIQGGVIYVNSTKIMINNCNFIKTKTPMGHTMGNAIYFYNLTNSSINDCSFINSTDEYTGAIYGAGINSSVNNCNFINSNFIITGCYQIWEERNYSNYWLIYEYNYTNFDINNCSFEFSKVNFHCPNSCINDCHFKNTELNVYGTNVTVNNCDFDWSTIMWNSKNGTMTNCKSNTSHCVNWTWNASNGIINNCEFVNSSNCINTRGYNFTLNNSKFINCSDCVDWTGLDGTISNCNFMDLTLVWYLTSPIIKWNNGRSGKLINCNFSNITGFELIYLNETSLIIEDCFFTDNEVNSIIRTNCKYDLCNISLKNNFVDKGVFLYNKGGIINTPTSIVFDSKVIPYGDKVNISAYLYDTTGNEKYNIIVDGYDLYEGLPNINKPVTLELNNITNKGTFLYSENLRYGDDTNYTGQINFVDVDSSDLPIGTYNLTYNGTYLNNGYKYSNLTCIGNLTIIKAPANLIIEGTENLNYRDSINVVKVISNTSKIEPISIIIFKDNIEYTKDTFDAGSYKLVATLENDNYEDNIISKEFIVKKSIISLFFSREVYQFYNTSFVFQVLAHDKKYQYIEGIDLIMDIYNESNIIETLYATTNNSGIATFHMPNLPIGTFKAIINNDNCEINYTITNISYIFIDKIPTDFAVTSVITSYNLTKDLVITLTDNQGSPMSLTPVSVDLNGAKNYITDSNGQIKIAIKNLLPKTYTATITFIGNEYYNESSTTAKVIINKINTKFSVVKVTTTYNICKYLIATLKDSKGNLLKNKKVSVKVGSISKTLTTNSKGQVSVLVSNLVPKTYTPSISFAGDSIYAKSSTTTKVVIKKATPKLTASAKTFKVKVKTKNNC